MKITINIPKKHVPALLVAISNHAHKFGVSCQQIMDKPEAERTQMEKDDLKVWGAKAIALQTVKIAVKRQAGFK